MYIYKLMLEHMTDQQRFNVMLKLIVEVCSLEALNMSLCFISLTVIVCLVSFSSLLHIFLLLWCQ